MAGKGNQGKNVGKPGSPGWQPTDKSKQAGKTPPASGPIIEDHTHATSSATEQTQEKYEGLTGLFIVVEPVKQSSVRPFPEVVKRYVELTQARAESTTFLNTIEGLSYARLPGMQEPIETMKDTLRRIEESRVVNDLELLHYGLVRKS